MGYLFHRRVTVKQSRSALSPDENFIVMPNFQLGHKNEKLQREN